MLCNAPHSLAELIASRFSHDLANTLGAIGNGLELLDMLYPKPSAEKQLILDSFNGSVNQLKLLRMAFGPYGSGALSCKQLVDAWNASFALQIIPPPKDMKDDALQVMLLALYCIKSACTRKGEVSITDENALTLRTQCEKIKYQADLWGALEKRIAPQNLEASNVHFAALAQHQAVRTIKVNVKETIITLILK